MSDSSKQTGQRFSGFRLALSQSGALRWILSAMLAQPYANVTGGALRRKFADLLGATNAHIGWMQAIPNFIQAAQMFASLLIERLQRRKPLVLRCAAVVYVPAHPAAPHRTPRQPMSNDDNEEEKIDMKITDIKTAEVGGHGYSTYVRVYTDEGLTGTGECIHGGRGCPQLIKDMAELLRGEDPLDVERLWERLRRRYLFDGALAGNVVTAMTGVEIALWDLAGKALGVPVYRLLGGGGKYRDRIRLYCDCHAGREDTPEGNAAKAKEVVSLGFNAIKFDVDDLNHPKKLDRYNHTITPGELSYMVEKVAAIREAMGPEIDLCVDMHGRYDMTSGIRVAQALEPFNLLWLEEPVPPENPRALAEVRRASRTPICAGENLYTRWGFRELFEQQAVDVVMPDIPKCGGLAECRKIANMAETYYIPFAPHNVCGPLGTMASCHVCASVPNFLVLEWHWLERPHWNTLCLADEPIIQNGYIKIPEKPGIGLEVNEEVMREYLRPGTELFA